MKNSLYKAVLPVSVAITLILVTPAGSMAEEVLSYTSEQAASGKELYSAHCQKCHGNKLSNGQFGTPLKGAFFKLTWKDRTVGELLQYMYEEMPSDVPSRLTREEYAQVAAYIFQQNDLEAGDRLLASDPAQYETQGLPL